ncbi:MAG: ABC transporter substrate-binding protein [Candidatus Bathyarchaeia archaeon]
MKGKFLQAAVALVMLASLGGVLGLSQQEVIRIGFIGPLSAPGAFESGIEMRMAAELAIDEINAQGGLLGKRVELVVADSQGLPEPAKAAMERLITKEKVVGVVGEFHSSAAIPEAKVAHEYHIPFVVAEAWSDMVTTMGYPEVFRIAPANSMIYDQLADWIEAAGFKNVVALIEDTDFGIGVDETLKDRLGKKGIKYTSIIAERTLLDFTPQLLQFKTMKPRPDFFLNVMTGPACFRGTKQACEIGFAPTPATGLFNAGSDALYPEFWQAVGECGKYTTVQNIGLPQRLWNARTIAFVQAFTERFGRPPTAAAMESYDATWLMAKAIDNRLSTDPDQIIAGLERIDWVGTRGLYYFSTSHEPPYMYHQFPMVPMMVIEYTEVGQTPEDASILWPRVWATVEEVYIVPSR